IIAPHNNRRRLTPAILVRRMCALASAAVTLPDLLQPAIRQPPLLTPQYAGCQHSVLPCPADYLLIDG
ncbi:MAG: hypothetical protein WBO57_02340, partial [Gammaproteobacteria bacterium]